MTEENAARIEEIKKSIKHYEAMIKSGEADFTAQTWIGLQLKELRKELRELKKQQS